jgi:hypothetical protein
MGLEKTSPGAKSDDLDFPQMAGRGLSVAVITPQLVSQGVHNRVGLMLSMI